MFFSLMFVRALASAGTEVDIDHMPISRYFAPRMDSRLRGNDRLIGSAKAHRATPNEHRAAFSFKTPNPDALDLEFSPHEQELSP